MTWVYILAVIFLVVGVLYFTFIGCNIIANFVAVLVFIVVPGIVWGVMFGLVDRADLSKWWLVLIGLLLGIGLSLLIVFAGHALSEDSSVGDDGKVIVVKTCMCTFVAAADLACWVLFSYYLTSLLAAFFALFSH